MIKQGPTLVLVFYNPLNERRTITMNSKRTEIALKGLEAVQAKQAAIKWIRKLKEESDNLVILAKAALRDEDLEEVTRVTAEMAVIKIMVETLDSVAKASGAKSIECAVDLMNLRN